jgi:ferredoxin-NADP reductase
MLARAPKAIVGAVARLATARAVRSIVDEHAFDFYAGKVSPLLALRRIRARVEGVVSETRDVRSFVLRPNHNWRGFRAGQHVGLTVEIAGILHTRAYSPSSAPRAADTITLTVKRHPHGRVSSFLHAHVRVGHVVEISQAVGDFVLPEPVPAKLLMISGGSGITPLMAMLRDLIDRRIDRDIVFVHYARTESDRIFADDLVSLGAMYPSLRMYFGVTRTPGPEGALQERLSGAHLDRIAPDAPERDTWVCGPLGLVEPARALWRERGYPVPPRVESFGPAVLAAGDGTEVALRFARSSLDVRGTTGIPLLVQAEAAGLTPPSGCRMGICGSCACLKRRGVVRNVLTGSVSEQLDDTIRLCTSIPLSDVTLDL